MSLSKSLRPKAAAELLGVGVSTFWRWAKERPGFPKARRLSLRCTVFDSDELLKWRDAQSVASNATQARRKAPADILAGGRAREVLDLLQKEGALTMNQIDEQMGRRCGTALAALLREGKIVGHDDVNPDTRPGKRLVVKHYALTEL